jgi:VanZ family protein
MPGAGSRNVGPRVGGGINAVALAALVGLILLLIFSAYAPFDWDPPRVVRNEVTRGADGALHFGEMNQARTPGTPDWLADARSSGDVQIDLEAYPDLRQENAEASIMMLASDFWHTDFAIGQNHSGLLLWLRRPGSDANGGPTFAIGGALQPGRWNHVEVALHGDSLRIDVNGTRRLTEELPADSLGGWGAGQVVLGGEVHGGVPWQGEIRRAEVRTPGHDVDYASPGALSIPAHYLYVPDHVAPFPPLNRQEWEALVFHLLSFIPIGFLIVWVRRPPLRPVPATLLAAALAVLLAAGKFFFYGRHMAVADIVVQTAGALTGAWVAWWCFEHFGARGRVTDEDHHGRREQGELARPHQHTD